MAFTVAGYVTRAALSLPNLSIESPGAYRIVSDDPGSLAWRKAVATSPYQHGEFLVGAVKDVLTAILAIRCYGSSASELNANVAALLRAFEQFSYTLSVSIEGVESRWICEPADYSVADGATETAAKRRGGFDKFALMSHQQTYVFNIPRSPVPAAGAF